MYKENAYIIYKKEVCRISNIININNDFYYELEPTEDLSLKIKIPVSKQEKYLRPLITKKELDKFILSIPYIEMLDINSKKLEDDYKALLQEGSLESLVKIIKTSNLRNEIKINNNKRLSDKDTFYLQRAEKYLYNEISYVLEIPYEEVQEYIKNKILYK